MSMARVTIPASTLTGSSASDRHTLDYYAVDRTGNTAGIRTLTISTTPPIGRFFGINHMDKILSANESGMRWGLRNQPDKRTTLSEIKGMGFNTIRLPLYWEGFMYYKRRNEVSVYVNRLKEIADIADDLNMKILYDNHHWGGSSHLTHNNARGIGFPAACMQALNIAKDTDYPTVAATFWSNFLTNYSCTIDGVTKPVWEHQWDYFRVVVDTTKGRRSTLGYEIMNEPMTYYSRYGMDQIRGLGNYYTFMARRIRSVAPNARLIVQFPLGGSATRDRDFSPYRNKEDAAYNVAAPLDSSGNRMDNVVWAFTFYSGHTVTGGSAREVAQFNNIKSIAESTGTPIWVSEWDVKPDIGELTPEAAVDYMRTFKSLGWGHTFFSYDPSRHSIKDDNYNDRYNSSRTMTFKQMLIDAVRTVYG
ncbi:MAG: cellulase family glycosylhydrolase [Candidatus Nitrosocaldus sp.]|nr:glycoside hydrolase family 5 protein [Candidatus Nitrosocaldus sp.]MCS7141425.1 glycoside hydrolase family 5 protein [Candidatus Nitrosocaldus sp.]MDW8000787.1 cellulase family glycosylhydrolase [Candidatus Nitrosocaldus sp.]MDW8275672.1 cellulase family glycosylhydrolase [Candidatus Nitrosocaldus sp.]